MAAEGPWTQRDGLHEREKPPQPITIITVPAAGLKVDSTRSFIHSVISSILPLDPSPGSPLAPPLATPLPARVGLLISCLEQPGSQLFLLACRWLGSRCVSEVAEASRPSGRCLNSETGPELSSAARLRRHRL